MKTTYLLGAGASKDAIPMSNELPTTMDEWARNQSNNNERAERVRNHPGYNKLREAVASIANKGKTSKDIDTYAHELILRNDTGADKELRLLKATLSCWLLWQQFGNRLDPRYRKFFSQLASRPSGPIVLNEDVNILSWNYDLQPEIACRTSLNVEPHQIPSLLQAPPFETGSDQKIDTDRFFLVRLNGCAGAHRIGDNHQEVGSFTRMIDLIYREDRTYVLEEILDLFVRYLDHNELDPAINFAWEPESMWRLLFRSQVLPALKATKRLVVIGYSFPSTNIEIDREILNSMSPERVIVQNPDPKIVVSRMRDLVNWREEPYGFIEPVDQVESFEFRG